MESVATRYASALVNLGIEEKSLERLRLQALDLLEILKKDNPFYQLLTSSFVAAQDKYQFLDASLKSDGLKTMNSFLKVLVRNHRIKKAFEILQAFIALANETLRIKQAVIYSAVPLSDSQIKQLIVPIEQTEQCKIDARNELDRSLIGGVKIEVEGKLYDGSIQSRLQALKESLLTRGKK